MRVVPELYCSNINTTRDFYTRILQFSIKYERTEDEFIFLVREGVELMIESLNSHSRKFLTDEITPPFGQGINFQWDVSNIDELYQNIQNLSPDHIFLAMEIKKYRVDESIIEQQQFIVKDPDGYLFRFCQ